MSICLLKTAVSCRLFPEVILEGKFIFRVPRKLIETLVETMVEVSCEIKTKPVFALRIKINLSYTILVGGENNKQLFLLLSAFNETMLSPRAKFLRVSGCGLLHPVISL